MNVKKVKYHLQMARFHTVPLETIPAIVGASIASAALFDINVLLFGVFGVLYHVSGYYANSYIDWEKGFDKTDEQKSHFPLNAETLTPSEASYAMQLLLIITAFYGLIITFHNVYAFIAVILMPVFGMSYNLFGKYTELKFIPISISHALIFVVAYLGSGGANILILAAGFMTVLLQVLYQIAISGEAKDMDTDEENLLITLGAEYSDGKVTFSSITRYLSLILKVLDGLAAAILVYSVMKIYPAPFGLPILAFVIVVSSGYIFGNKRLLADGEYIRSDRIGQMARIELSVLLAMIIATVPILGWLSVGIIFIMSIIWVLTFNKMLWDTLLSPDV